MESKTFYRVSNERTQQGLWYNMAGEFTGLIHDRFNFCKNTALKMEFDPALKGYLSATTDIPSLLQWFPIADILELQKHGYYIYKYVSDDFKYYDKFSHYIIHEKAVIIEKIAVEAHVPKGAYI